MHNSDDQDDAQHDAARAHESDEAQAERTAAVVRMLANPRRVRRA